jgi:hypothetical protein
MDELSKRLRAAGREAVPERDLWPAVDARIRSPRLLQWQHAAAAVLLFGLGALMGVLVERGGGAGPAVDSHAAATASPLYAAAAVQRAGSDYVAAVARLAALGDGDEALRAQAYEAALGVLSVTAQEVTVALDLRDHTTLIEHARRAHAAASQRVAVLIGQSEP